MLKKLIVASAMLALFACSSDSDDPPEPGNGNGSSSSAGTGDVSSSSGTIVLVKDTVPLIIASFNRGAEKSIFDTYAYGYTLVNSEDGTKEDLTQFWDPACPSETTTAPASTCELKDANGIKAGAILQNTLTSQYSPLHYTVDGIRLPNDNRAIKLDRYSLKEGNQAALGLNIGLDANEGKSIEDLGITKLDSAISLAYRYWGGKHQFRAVSATDDDFWYYQAENSQQDTTHVSILFSEFAGMGSFAADEEAGTPATPFDVSKVTKFLWVIEYDADTPSNNEGSLLIDYLEADIKVEYEELQ